MSSARGIASPAAGRSSLQQTRHCVLFDMLLRLVRLVMPPHPKARDLTTLLKEDQGGLPMVAGSPRLICRHNADTTKG